ncbi:MAG: hypothetical protein HFJ66_06030 [Eggerthellaceae bacterium]|nr:hypothetical protein [Eggerthellaceae bacterium]
MVPAIIIGFIVGIVGFAPLLGALALVKRTPSQGLGGSVFWLLLALVVSFVLLVVAVFIAISISKDFGLPFLFAEALGLSLTAIGFGVWRLLHNR